MAASDKLTARVQAMLVDRGYAEVKSLGNGKLVGRKQKSAAHPRPNGDALVFVDQNPSFSSADVHRTMKIVYATAVQEKLDPSSSIVYVYTFPGTRQHLGTVAEGYAVAREKGPDYHLELLGASMFDVDRTDKRNVRAFQFMRAEDFVWVIGNSGKAIVVDKPPALSNEDSLVQYYGGRKGDYVKYQRLEKESVGPIWLTTMAVITEKVVANLPAGAVKESEEGVKAKKEEEPAPDFSEEH